MRVCLWGKSRGDGEEKERKGDREFLGKWWKEYKKVDQKWIDNSLRVIEPSRILVVPEEVRKFKVEMRNPAKKRCIKQLKFKNWFWQLLTIKSWAYYPPFPSLNMPTYQVRIKRSTIQRQREIHMRRCIWKHLAEVLGADIFKFDWIFHFSLISISSICHRGLLNQAHKCLSNVSFLFIPTANSVVWAFIIYFMNW